jgi:hypothetical protein
MYLKGVIMNRASALTSHQRTSSKQLNKSRNRPLASKEHNRSSKPSKTTSTRCRGCYLRLPRTHPKCIGGSFAHWWFICSLRSTSGWRQRCWGGELVATMSIRPLLVATWACSAVTSFLVLIVGVVASWGRCAPMLLYAVLGGCSQNRCFQLEINTWWPYAHHSGRGGGLFRCHVQPPMWRPLHGFSVEPRILFSPSGIVPRGDKSGQWWSSSSGGREERPDTKLIAASRSNNHIVCMQLVLSIL